MNVIQKELNSERKALAAAQAAGNGYLCVAIQENIDRLAALTADDTHGIDSTGQRFAYDPQPLPLLNPGLVDA